MSEDRRDFFKKVAGAAVTLASAQAVLDAASTTVTAEAAIVTDKRAFVGGHFALELDDVMAGFLRSTEGGNVFADVIEEVGEGCFVNKHIGQPKYEDIKLEIGLGMSAPFYEWIHDYFDCEAPRKNGAVLSVDFKFHEVARTSFTDALITEFGMPACDAGSKDAAFMTVKFSPELIQMKKGSGQTVPACAGAKVQKKWLPANFRLKIDGLDCTKVNKIDAITLKQGVTEDDIGEGRDFRKEPGRLEVPNLVVTLPESAAQSFFEWHEDFVINGNSSSEGEKNGTLEYLTPNLAETLFTINFHNLGIFKLAPEKLEAGGAQIRRVKAEMYCERMEFKFGPGAVGC